jgi:hypothetical protein
LKKYLNFLVSFISSKLASLIFVYILYNFHSEEIWKTYALYLVNISLFRNITFSFTSNLGHEGLLTSNEKTYKKLFSTILFIVFTLQTIGLLLYLTISDVNLIFIYSYFFAIVTSFQNIVLNYQRFSLKYNEYSKSTLFFSYGNLIVVGVFFFNSLQTYLLLLILVSLLMLINYYKIFIEIVNSFDFNFFKNNIKKLSISSLRLYLINTLPDSLFIVYVPLAFSGLLSNVDYAVLVFLLSLFSVKAYPIITLIIQENMDFIKKYHYKTGYLKNLIIKFRKNELIITLLITSCFLLLEIFYIYFFAKPLIITFTYFGFIFWILPLVFLRHFVNSIIEVHNNIKYKFSPSLLSIILLLSIYYLGKVSIFTVVTIYWINLMHLSIKHIRSNFLSLNLFFNFYKTYFFVGILFHLNYLVTLSDIGYLKNVNSYIFISFIIIMLLSIIFRKFIFKLLQKNNLFKIKQKIK